jgi:hypothetical protein
MVRIPRYTQQETLTPRGSAPFLNQPMKNPLEELSGVDLEKLQADLETKDDNGNFFIDVTPETREKLRGVVSARVEQRNVDTHFMELFDTIQSANEAKTFNPTSHETNARFERRINRWNNQPPQ